MKVLIVGGLGFIGSTVASACEDAGIDVVVLDDLSTGRKEFARDRPSYVGDAADRALLGQIFDEHPDIEVTLHAAAKIVVPDSVLDPVTYYRENVSKTLELVDVLLELERPRLVFSSSAAIYRPGPDSTVDESSEWEPLSPYARTKAHVETMLRDVCATGRLRVMSLRYFNPIGADPLLRTGLQLPTPTHALGQLIRAHRDGAPFQVYGQDYPTRDGTGIRDYVHVWDLATAHVAALRRFDDVVADEPYLALNLGTGTGTTVRELVSAFEDVVGERIDVRDVPRRAGDTAGAYTRTSRAARTLEWRAERDVRQGIADTLAWFEVRGSMLSMPW